MTKALDYIHLVHVAIDQELEIVGLFSSGIVMEERFHRVAYMMILSILPQFSTQGHSRSDDHCYRRRDIVESLSR